MDQITLGPVNPLFMSELEEVLNSNKVPFSMEMDEGLSTSGAGSDFLFGTNKHLYLKLKSEDFNLHRALFEKFDLTYPLNTENPPELITNEEDNVYPPPRHRRRATSADYAEAFIVLTLMLYSGLTSSKFIKTYPFFEYLYLILGAWFVGRITWRFYKKFTTKAGTKST